MKKYFLGNSTFLKFLLSILIIHLPFSSNSQVKENVFKIGYVDILYGLVYEPENSTAFGHPFFLEEDIQKATLWFNGDKIEDVFVKYDLYNQTLVLSQNLKINKYNFIILNSRSIDKFEIIDKNNNTFKFIPSSAHPGLPSEIVFYEVVYSNRIKYLIGRKKVIELINDNKSRYLQEQRNYFIINSELYEANNRREIYNLFGNYKKEIKRYVKKNKIRVKRNSVKEITQLIIFYEKLSNQQ